MLKLRFELLILLLLFGLGLALRLVGLGWESIWLDEAFSLDMARYSYANIWRGEPLDPGNPPGYYLILHGWLKLFVPKVETLVAGRALSGVFGALTILATWWLARAAGCGATVRLLAALLVAVSPPLVFLSRELRVYTLFGLMITLAAASAESLVSAIREKRWINAGLLWLAFTLSCASLNYLHYYSILVLPVLGLYLFVRLGLINWKWSLLAVLAMVCVAVAFLPWLALFREQIRLGTTRGGATWLMHLAITPLHSLAGHTLVWKQDGSPLVGLLTAIATLCVYIPVLIWLVRSGRWPVAAVVVSMGLIAMAVVISLAKSPMLQSRYLSAIYPCLMVVLATGLIEGYSQWRRGARIVSWTLAGLMVASLSLMYAQLHKEDWRPIAGFVSNKGIALPAYCYEDVAKLSFNYYAPWVRMRSIDPVAEHFSPDGKKWEENGLAEKMRGDKEGFWFILYLSLPTTQPELASIDSWLRTRFHVTDEYGDKLDDASFPFLHLYRAEQLTSSMGNASSDQQAQSGQ